VLKGQVEGGLEYEDQEWMEWGKKLVKTLPTILAFPL
jgi:hypothetical protein